MTIKSIVERSAMAALAADARIWDAADPADLNAILDDEPGCDWLMWEIMDRLTIDGVVADRETIDDWRRAYVAAYQVWHRRRAIATGREESETDARSAVCTERRPG